MYAREQQGADAASREHPVVVRPHLLVRRLMASRLMEMLRLERVIRAFAHGHGTHAVTRELLASPS